MIKENHKFKSKYHVKQLKKKYDFFFARGLNQSSGNYLLCVLQIDVKNKYLIFNQYGVLLFFQLLILHPIYNKLKEILIGACGGFVIISIIIDKTPRRAVFKKKIYFNLQLKIKILIFFFSKISNFFPFF